MAIDFSFFDNTSLFIKSDKRKDSGKDFCEEKLFFEQWKLSFLDILRSYKGLIKLKFLINFLWDKLLYNFVFFKYYIFIFNM